MIEVEDAVAAHYANRTLEATILAGLAAAGADGDRPTLADLAPVDEFHIGGREATVDLLAQLDLPRDARVLDVGCGLGGTSRYLAAELGAQVDGIDLKRDYVQTAKSLAHRVGLGGRIAYHHGSALALPFAPATFDAATMLHVGMNVSDKGALFAEVRRVLKSGASFAVYDVMREANGALDFPVPWATEAGTSFVAPAAVYRGAMEAAGFRVVAERSRRDFALAFFAAMRARMAGSAPPPLGLHILMGADARQKIANMIGNIERGMVAPTELIARAV